MTFDHKTLLVIHHDPMIETLPTPSHYHATIKNLDSGLKSQEFQQEASSLPTGRKTTVQ